MAEMDIALKDAMTIDGAIGVALVDRSNEALSAVYCYYDPSFEQLGIGTF